MPSAARSAGRRRRMRADQSIASATSQATDLASIRVCRPKRFGAGFDAQLGSDRSFNPFNERTVSGARLRWRRQLTTWFESGARCFGQVKHGARR